MLTKILNIEGIGLLHQASGAKRTRLEKRTLVYAENGRGKSTLASILNSCGRNDGSLIEDRVTIDGTVPPTVSLMFDDRQVKFQNGQWSGKSNDVIVYDANFVSDNVHSGSEVTTNQRANLLDFALGTTAVQAREEEQNATQIEKEDNQKLKELSQKLDGLLGGRMPVAAFRALPQDEHIDARIDEANQRLTVQQRSAEIKRLPVPQEISLPEVDLEAAFEILNRTLENIHAEAAARVSEHLNHLNDSNAGAWVQHGLSVAKENQCPFCGQDTDGLELLELYRVYFDDAYRELQHSVESTLDLTLKATDPKHIATFSDDREQNNKYIETWQEYLPVTTLDSDRDELAQASLVNLQDLLGSLYARKTNSIAEAHADLEDLEELKRLWDQFESIYRDENTVIRAHQQQIDLYKTKLETGDLASINESIKALQLQKLRYEPSTESLIQDIKATEVSLREAEQKKKSARDNLNAVMHNTLTQFKDAINEHLTEFGADFQIDELSHSYRGPSPRTEYQIKLRGEAIKLKGGRPTFATALSEGDKRTMGFAFFAASTLADQDLSNKIVVIDDPMSSLDASRRDHTVKVIEAISEKAGQLVLMAHDEHFLRDARERLWRSDKTTGIAEISLRMTSGKYSDFADLDLDAMCESDYLKHYKLVSGVASGRVNDPEGLAQAAVALRPLLEGYLHRKYPEAIPSGGMLGEAITEIENTSDSASPLITMAPHVAKLRAMNDYSSKFHHNTQPDYVEARKVTHQELASRGKKILDFVHST